MQQGMEHAAEHTLNLSNRRRAEATGILDVECFNEEIAVLVTGIGTLSITGSGLSIPELRLEEGRVVVEGELTGVEYAGRVKDGKGGWFRRMFR